LSFLPAGGRRLLRSDLRPSMDQPLAPLLPPTELQVAVASPADSFMVQRLSSSFSQPTAGANKHVISNYQQSFQSTINDVCRVASLFPIRGMPFIAQHVRAWSLTLTSLSSPLLTFSLGSCWTRASTNPAHLQTRCDGQDTQKFVFSDCCGADIPPL
jgi:hypothetical protein